MVNVADPVGTGLVSNLQRPGGNITGVSNFVGDMTPKLFDLLRGTVRGLARVAVLWNPENQSAHTMMKGADVAAQKLGVQLLRVSARNVNEIDQAFVQMTHGQSEALLVLAEPLFFANRVKVVDLALKARLASIYNTREYAEAGGLMTYGANIPEGYRYAARYVDKILKGAKPGDLPVEQVSKVEFVVNLKTAKALGLAIPQSILVLADQVIQ